MLLVKHEKLHFKDEKSDKVYEIELFHIQEDEYIVNFRYGRRGRRLNEGTKTVFPVPKEKAEKVFQDLLESKTKKGYKVVSEYSDEVISKASDGVSENEASISVILKYLKDQVNLNQQQQNWKLSRIIWRAAELKIEEAIPLVHDLMPRLEGQETYAAIWLLGRIGNAQCLQYLNSYSVDFNDMHYNIYKAALLNSGDKAQEQKIIRKLPLELKTSYQSSDYEKFYEVVNQYLYELKVEECAFILKMYLLSINNSAIKNIVNDLLQSLKLVPGKWKYIRYIYKIAEMIDDGETLGILTKRIHTESAYYHSSYGGYAYLNSGRLNIKEESAKKNSKLAFSKGTKDYFIRRALRHLVQMGSDHQESYCIVATGILKAYNESDYKDHSNETTYTYDRDSRKYTQHIRVFPKLAHVPYMYYILYNRGERLSNNFSSRFYFDGEPTVQTTREDSYPTIWNKYPKYAVELLADGKLKEVIDFAFLVLKTCNNIDDLITRYLLSRMIQSPFDEVIEYSLNFIKKRYQNDVPDIEIIALLIESENEKAINLALELMSKNKQLFINNSSFILTALLVENMDLQNWIRSNVQSNLLSETEIKEIVDGVFQHYYQLDEGSFKSESAETLIVVFKDYLSNLQPEELTKMIDHPLVQIQLFGAKLININKAQVSEWPDSLLLKMLSSDHNHIRDEGMKLLSRMTDNELIERDSYISELASSKHQDLRLKARDIISRLAPISKSFSEKVFNNLFHILQDSHEDDELPLDVYETIRLHLKESAFKAVEEDTEAFLKSTTREIQLLAFDFVESNMGAVKDWPIEYFALMGMSDSKPLRKIAFEMYESNIEKVKYNAFEAVKILDTEWDEAFSFATQFMDTHFDSKTWSPELIISLCDSTIPRVQEYGTSVLSRFFTEENGTKYLEQLSEHPDAIVQLYCTNYLDRFAWNNEEVLIKLKPYFIRILSSINSRRVAKIRAFTFLEKQAKESSKMAAYVSDILSKVVGTLAKSENEKYVGLLHEIEKSGDNINTDLEILPLEIRS